MKSREFIFIPIIEKIDLYDVSQMFSSPYSIYNSLVKLYMEPHFYVRARACLNMAQK